MQLESQQTALKKLPRLKPRGGLAVMQVAIKALILRELQTRFGQYRLGYLWVFLEPLLTIGIMVLVFGTVVCVVYGWVSSGI